MIRFRMEWQDAPGVRDTVLARSWCRLVIEAGGRLVTEAVHDASNSLRGGDRGRNEYDRARRRRMKWRMPMRVHTIGRRAWTRHNVPETSWRSLPCCRSFA